jgi:soluble lytic murein transglycosylase-like protein
MIRPQKAILPGIILSSFVLVLFTRFLTTPQTASAATQSPDKNSSSVSVNNTAACSLSSLPDSIQPWCTLIDQAAQKYEVSPELIAAVMLQESGGQPEVISASGAVGLLQVMPKDGIAASFMCANGPCFASRPSTQELMDPAFNVDYGVRMLANLIAKYGNERDALKSYGPYNVGYYYADKVLTIKANL